MNANPNIVFILADDLGYGDLSIFNGGMSSTPTLDSLMEEGVCLTQQYAASPVCNPSRAALMTGRYPHRTGSIDTLEWWGLERLAIRETTIAEVLSSFGYKTGLIGKWHLGAFDPRYHPARRGFDETICFRGGMHDYYEWRIEYGDIIKRGDGRYLTDVWTEEAVSFIKRQTKGQPFYLQVAYNAPHTPLQAPEEEVRPFSETNHFNKGVSTLYGMVHRMDTGIAQILDVLEMKGLDENTIVVFTSDNGPQFGYPSSGQTQMEWTLDRFNCNYNGAKGLTYEGGIRVPLVIRWPAGLQGGRKVNAMAHFTDWFPTLLVAADVPVPPSLDLDGTDIWTVVTGDRDETETRRFWQWNRFTPELTSNAAVRDGAWKLVRPRIDATMTVPDLGNLQVSMYNPEHFVKNGIIESPFPKREILSPHPPELYNIEVDPEERFNRAEEEKGLVNRLLSDLETWFEEVEAERATITDCW